MVDSQNGGRYTEAVAEAKKRLSLPDWLKRQGVEVKKSGTERKTLCPFHGDKSPSLVVYDDHYHCFACQAHGDHVTWLRERNGLSFVEAVELLAADAGVVIPEAATRARIPAPRRQRLYEVNEAACRWLVDKLWANPQGLEYLRGRGLTDESIRAWRIGWNPKGTWRHLEEHLTQLGMLAEAKELALVKLSRNNNGGWRDAFADRLTFPVCTPTGDIAGFSARLLQDDPRGQRPKYINSDESAIFQKGDLLFGYHRARAAAWKARRVVMVEGQVDVIAMHQRGHVSTVAAMGTALTEDHADLLERAASREGTVVLCGDGDKAGREAMVKHAKALLQRDVQRLEVVALPDGADPADLAQREPAKLDALLAAPGDAVELVARDALAEKPDDSQGKLSAIRELQPWLVSMAPEKRDLLLDALARAMGVEPGLARSWLGSTRLRLGTDGRAIVTLSDDVSRMLADIDAAMTELALDVYVQDGELCHLRPGSRGALGAHRFPSAEALWGHLSSCIFFQEFKREGPEPAKLPLPVARAYLGRGRWGMRQLVAVTESPFMRPDGSICTTPGYDPATRTFLVGGVQTYPPVPDAPTKADAEEALNVLLELTTSFEFESAIDRAAAVAAFITPLVRSLCPTVPAFWCDGTVPEAGKSEIPRVASVLCNGHDRTATPAGAEDLDKVEAKLLARMIDRNPVIQWDNIPSGSGFGTAWLCSWLTETAISTRLLYDNKSTEVDNVSTFYLSGNNLHPAHDMSVRVVRVRLVDRPKPGATPPSALALANRWRYMRAAWTLVRAYQLSGEPVTFKTRQRYRFGEWDRVVRSPFVWLGFDDPLGNFAAIEAEDVTRENHGAVLDAWRTLYGAATKRVSDVVEDLLKESQEPALKELRATVTEFLGGRKPNEQNVGRLLQTIGNGVTIGRHQLVKTVIDGKRMWSVRKSGASALQPDAS